MAKQDPNETAPLEQLLADANAAKLALEAELEATRKEVSELLAINADLQEKLAAKPVAKADIISIGGEAYALTAPKFRYNGEDIDADRLSEDPLLAAELVEKGVGVLVKID